MSYLEPHLYPVCMTFPAKHNLVPSLSHAVEMWNQARNLECAIAASDNLVHDSTSDDVQPSVLTVGKRRQSKQVRTHQ